MNTPNNVRRDGAPLVKRCALAMVSCWVIGAPVFCEAAWGQAPATSPLDFVMGSFEFALLHELAHVVLTEKDVPVLGPIESAADYIGATILLAGTPDDAVATQVLHGFVASAANAFANSWAQSTAYEQPVPYWDTHALSIQRYYSILCLLYGSDPQSVAHQSFAEQLPSGRAQVCEYEFERAHHGLQWLLDTYGRQPDEPPGHRAVFEYGKPRSQQQLRILNEIKRLTLFESTVNALTDKFAFDKPFKASLRACGSQEAAWLPDKRELVVCYELLDAFMIAHLRAKRKKTR